MVNKKALRLIELGLHPVLLGREGDNLKRPLLKGWQTAVYTAADVRTWPPQNNVGIRCGLQRSLPRTSRGGRHLIVFDFDGEATRIYPTWRRAVVQRFRQPLVTVVSARGYHSYFFTSGAHPGRTLAGRYVQTLGETNGRKQLFKFIETLGGGR
ncbi:MAG: bifunctional DNA primase/polymerase [Anaerolineae bacterium]|nr:bifunctional DNA primase/polymerase [Anaerolineae bacterium]